MLQRNSGSSKTMAVKELQKKFGMNKMVAWCYQYLLESKCEKDIRWRDIRDITNLVKDNFITSLPYLGGFTDEGTAGKTRNLLPAQDLSL